MKPKRSRRIAARLAFWLVLVALVPLLLLTFSTTWLSGSAVRNDVYSHLAGIADNKVQLFEQYFWERRNDARVTAALASVQAFLQGRSDDAELRRTLDEYLEAHGYRDVYLIDDQSQVVARARGTLPTSSQLDLIALELARVVDAARTLLQVEVSGFERDDEGGRLFIAAPVLDAGRVIGVIALEVGSEGMRRLTRDLSGLKNSGEIVIAAPIDGVLTQIAPSRHHPNAAFAYRFGHDPLGRLLSAAQGGAAGSAEVIDRRGVPTLATARFLPSLNGALLVQIDRTEAMQSLVQQRQRILGIAALAVLGALLATVVIARTISRPVEQLTASVRAMMSGQLKQRAEVGSRDELGVLADSFNAMARQLAESIETLEQRVAQRTQDLAAATQLAQAASRAKGEFLANMSHEIRTPLNAVIGLSGLALNHAQDPKLRDYLRKIHAAAEGLLGLINDILDMSKIEAGKLTLEQTRFSLNQVLDNVISVVGLRAYEKGLELLLRLPPDVPDVLLGDPLRFGQVLINLGSNAVKFTERGHVAIEIQWRALPSTGDDQARVELRCAVIDTGIGLSAAQQQKLFQAFVQADTSTARKYGGSGLGLRIAKELVQAMGGEIGVQSEEGKGATFFFTAVFGCVTPSEGRTEAPVEFKAQRALVVDDNEVSREILREQLSRLGFEVHCVSSGPAALAELRRVSKSEEHGYDLVMMDYRMPEMDGLEATARIRADRSLKPLPVVIMVSAFGRDDVEYRASQLGVNAFLAKPVGPSLLHNVLAQAFGLAAPDSPRPRERIDLQQIRETLRGLRVLLAEDHPINQQVASELLSQVGVRVSIANNGREAIQALSGEAQFDLVLMDLQMPEVDGLEATREIRRRFDATQLPIVAMTAHAFEEEKRRCLEAGMNAHLVKPVVPAELYAALAKWSGRTLSAPTAPDVPKARAAGLEPVIDVDLGLSFLGGNETLYRDLLRRFLETHAEDVQRITSALEQGERDRARQIVHALKGPSATLGMRALHRAASRFEDLLASGERRLSAAIADLRTAMTDVLMAPEAHFETLVEPTCSLSDQAREELRTQLGHLDRCLRDNDFAAVHRFRELEQGLLAVVPLAQIHGLGVAIERLDYVAALAQLRTVQQQVEQTTQSPTTPTTAAPHSSTDISHKPIDPARWKELLDLLKEQDLAALATFESGRNELSEQIGAEAVEQFARLLAALDFERAHALLKQHGIAR